MPPNAQALSPKIFAIWVRTLRIASNLSQDALAEAAGVSERTIQRIESGARSNPMTRRSLARGFGYKDLDIFDDPSFIKTATEALAEIHAEATKTVEANNPDHIKLIAEPVNRGAQIADLIGQCDAWVFQCDDSISLTGQRVSAVLFDNVQDYGDVWTELSPSAQLEARSTFAEMVDEIANQGLCAY